MARSVIETAIMLKSIYNKNFANESFCIKWPELRGIAGISQLTQEYLQGVNNTLNESGHALLQLDNFLLVAHASDFPHVRHVPPRLVEQYLHGDDELDDDEYEESEDEILVDEDDSDDQNEPESGNEQIKGWVPKWRTRRAPKVEETEEEVEM